ncbi:hypothetical protein GWI33_006598 [Rhynchophorus ferrugineus]|uniref:DNA 3'-5' helicase n=1 Tax=Rhynchophorus ferrugineus TaxID=354439 RepID=A0A834IUA5_RHYFE|nr:hypothetical protein GWI33_006598 [Rhynchophorus ferrugineus]
MSNNLRSINDIPLPYRIIFESYPCFNAVQSKVLDDAVFTDKSMVIAAPTGSGKSAIFEMAIVRILMTYSVADIKVIYISPVKALCQEKLIDWHRKFSEYDMQCIALTSDTDDIDPKSISNYHLIISTPEKWDVITRRWRDNQKLVSSINLFMIDEVHLLNADTRGSTLEVIVSRMKTIDTFILNQGFSKIRFIAVSATIPNVEDISEWIGPSGTASFYKFSEEVRPVKLNKIVCGFFFQPKRKSMFQFDLSLNYKLQYLIPKYSDGQPTLIFCNTRKSVEMTAKHLVENLQIRLSEQQKDILVNISSQLTDTKLKQYVLYGIAFHHAGLVRENRYSVEESFRQGHIPILVTTSTLAMGVNLPAHLVIIKSTKCYDCNEGYKDYDEVSIFQMIGRAGRCQFDTSATALILTTMQDKAKYEKMVACTQPIESNLHKHLTEHLNAEIVLKTITDLEVAMRWLSSTFLYVRAKKYPEKYKLPSGLTQEKIDKKLLDICQIDLNKLVAAGMVKLNQAIEISPTVVGEIMAKFYVAFDTMKLFTQITGNEIMIQLLAFFSKCHEFSEIRLRSNDKKCLNLLNKHSAKETVRFPMSGKIVTSDMKVNCIIQAILGNLEIQDQSLLNDSIRIMRCCERLSRCLIEYLETRKKCYVALLNATILAKCFKAKLWENSPYVAKQLTGVGQVFSLLFVKAGLTTFESIANTNPRIIEMHIGRKPPFGNNIVDHAKHIPRYSMKLVNKNSEIWLEIALENVEDLQVNSTVNLNSTMTLLIGDSDNNLIIYEKYSHSYMLDVPKIEKLIKIETADLYYISADFISDDWIGFDCNCKVELVPENLSKPSLNRNKQTMIDSYMQKTKTCTSNKKKITEDGGAENPNVRQSNGESYLNTENKENLYIGDQCNTSKNICTPSEKNIVETPSSTTKEDNLKLSDENIPMSQQFIFSAKKPIAQKRKRLLVGTKIKPRKIIPRKQSRQNSETTEDQTEQPPVQVTGEKVSFKDNVSPDLRYTVKEIVEPEQEELKLNSEERKDFIHFSNEIFGEEFMRLLEDHNKNIAETNGNDKEIIQNLTDKSNCAVADSGQKSPIMSNFYEINQSKSIKWRSPLIQSPCGRFSPSSTRNCVLDNGAPGNKENHHRNNEFNSGIQEYSFDFSRPTQSQHTDKIQTPSSRKTTKFPITDQDCRYDVTPSNKKQKVDTDIIDLEHFGLGNVKLNASNEKSVISQSSACDYFSQLDKQSSYQEVPRDNNKQICYSGSLTPDSLNSTLANTSSGNFRENSPVIVSNSPRAEVYVGEHAPNPHPQQGYQYSHSFRSRVAPYPSMTYRNQREPTVVREEAIFPSRYRDYPSSVVHFDGGVYLVEPPPAKRLFDQRTRPLIVHVPDSSPAYTPNYTPSNPRPYLHPYAEPQRAVEPIYYQESIPYPPVYEEVPPSNTFYEPPTPQRYPCLPVNRNSPQETILSQIQTPSQYFVPTSGRNVQPITEVTQASHDYGYKVTDKQERPSLERSRYHLKATYGCTPKKQLVHKPYVYRQNTVMKSPVSQRNFEEFEHRLNMAIASKDNEYTGNNTNNENNSSGYRFQDNNQVLINYFSILSISVQIHLEGIQINYVEVPTAVRNDSNRSAILDCNYSIRPGDTELTVKWYLNDDLIYQWIPPQNPQSLGILKDNIDLNYKASDDPKTVYRAIKINNPTTQIAGEYKCVVSTLADEDFSMKNMIVFEPETKMVIKKKMDNKYVNFSCLATDVYPSPKLLLYKDIKNNFHNKVRLSIVEWDIKKNPDNGKFSIFIIGTDRVSELQPGSLIHCELKIPGTGYVKLKTLLYYPDTFIIRNGCADKSFYIFLIIIPFHLIN